MLRLGFWDRRGLWLTGNYGEIDRRGRLCLYGVQFELYGVVDVVCNGGTA